MKKLEKYNRNTVALEPEVYRDLLETQAQIIKKTKNTCNFSETVTIVLEVGLRKMQKKKFKKSKTNTKRARWPKKFGKKLRDLEDVLI